jgi:hypothetical protein
MNDEAHAKLLGMLAEQKFAGTSRGVREELLHFFSDPDAPYATKRNVEAWAKVQEQLEQLKATPR